jgi:Rrf2 family protein
MWSKSCRYGMMICGRLADQPDAGFIPVKRLGEDLGIASYVLAKVVQRLARAGILESLRGPRGGVRLTKSASKMPIRRLTDEFDDLTWLDSCPFHPESNHLSHLCPVHDSWAVIRQDVQRFIDTTTIGDLKRS